MDKEICPKCSELNVSDAIVCAYCGSSMHQNSVNNEQVQQILKNDVSYEVSIKEWVLILIGTALPGVNIAVLLYLLFKSKNETLHNYAAALLIMIVVMGLALVLINSVNSIGGMRLHRIT